MIGAGLIALYTAIMRVKFIAMANFSNIGILGVMHEYMLHIIIGVIITLVVSTVITFIQGVKEDDDLAVDTDVKGDTRQVEKVEIEDLKDTSVFSPMDGPV